MNLQLRHSLAWQMIGPIPLLVIALIAAIWFIVPRKIEDNASDQAVLAGRSIAAQFINLRKYYTENVVEKVVAGGTFRASPDYRGDAKAIPLPATMILDLSALLAKSNTTVSIYSKFPFPNRTNRVLDSFQQDAWDFLTSNPQETYSRQEMLGGKHVVRVAVADIMTVQTCVDCHNTIAESPRKNWKLGDVRGVLEVTSVIDSQLGSGAVLSHYIIGGAIAIGLGLLGIALLVARSVTRPIGALIGAMQRVAAGNFETALPGLGRKDEIGRLADGFNHMVSQLDAARKREAMDRSRAATMQAELTRVARLTTMGQLTAAMAHEINQPLAAIMASGDAGLRWLARTPPNFDEARAALNQIVTEGHRARDIVGGIRAVFRKGEVRRAPVNINELIEEVLLLMRAEIHNGRISVLAELFSDSPNVMGDRTQLQLVFRNLIMNAIEATGSVTDRERMLRVKSETVPSGVRVTVTDSGTGIDQHNMDRIFDTFFTTKSHGMGMGLSICRSIVEAHGGKLSASRSHPYGSIFEVDLPAAGMEDR
jgi:signal transduction histidine kinase